ncbi:MAG: AAA family ATPase [Gammaproteobacteria bacterium]|jgi:general secretion pathway protein A|nr:AAA family ATPase [Gammaproteobacteria bacterium]MDP6617631.1 AAA family ATPase [Gammaproteobacteria bacterium]MDP6694508.1 AAA family ATPase [Gammaproteobacteria bacterium]MDP7041082.1 AAA family ATPase [Gammaproteobacteria bacterium]
MYTSFFGLNEKPFSITPNPRYLYMSERHTEALAHLIYGIKDSGGFIQLTGEVGTGKTTLIRSLLQRLPENADVALILNPQLSATEFLGAILTELGVPQPNDRTSLKELTDALNNYLLENYSKGRRTILIVDEAQNFAVDVLEQIRLLTNLETASQKLLQITLIGQPELRTMLSRVDLRQLAQRITGRYHLEPLSQEETEEYVRHRLSVAGGSGNIFTSQACRELYRLSGGVPRIINVIADRTLLGAFTREEHEINPGMVRRAAAEVYGEDAEETRRGRAWLKVAGFALGAAVLTGAAVVTSLRFATERSAPQAPRAITAPAKLPAPTVATSIPEPAVAEPEPMAPAAEAVAGDFDLEQLMRDNATLTDTRTAFNALFSLWGVQFDDSNSRACEQAQSKNLYCLFQKGSLAQIERLDRPVIMTLRDYEGGIHQLVLEAIEGSNGIIAIADARYAVPLNEILNLWYGEYLLLWKPQIGAVKAFYPGMRDPDIAWLRQSLAEIQGNPIDPMNSDYFDENLEARVRNYQVAKRLNVDGLVGQQTQIVINTDLRVGAPRLARAN